MSDVRADAEAVLAWAEDVCMSKPRSPCHLENAAARVCEAWLNDHPEDDGEPVTADWVKAVGFEKVGRYGWFPADDTCPNLSFNERSGFLVMSGFHVIQKPTRGQFRRLAAALGLTLTESPA